MTLVVRAGSLSGRRGRLSSKTKTHRGDEQPSPPLPLLALILKANEVAKGMGVVGQQRRFVSKRIVRWGNHFMTQLQTQLTVHQILELIEKEYKSVVTFVQNLPHIGEIYSQVLNITSSKQFNVSYLCFRTFPSYSTEHFSRFWQSAPAIGMLCSRLPPPRSLCPRLDHFCFDLLRNIVIMRSSATCNFLSGYFWMQAKFISRPKEINRNFTCSISHGRMRKIAIENHIVEKDELKLTKKMIHQVRMSSKSV